MTITEIDAAVAKMTAGEWKLLVTGDKHKRIDDGAWDNTAIVSERAEAYRAGHSAAAMVSSEVIAALRAALENQQ